MTTATKSRKPDSALAAAVDAAREALTKEIGESEFADHLGVTAEAERVVTHLFATTNIAYAGWRWEVTLARAPRQKVVTVNEIALLPGEGALAAPLWVPWKDRVGKDDLGPGDLIPVSEDDLRLVPGYLVGDADLDSSQSREVREVIADVGLGRERVLSLWGREEAADRWLAGSHGPDDPIAKSAPARCGTCGFLVRLNGPLSATFGVCANASAPSDGQVVSYDHGCGAHSDVRSAQSEHQPSAASPFHDTLTRDVWDVWGDGELDVISTRDEI